MANLSLTNRIFIEISVAFLASSLKGAPKLFPFKIN